MSADGDGPYAFAYQCRVCDTVCESAPARSLALRNYRTHYWEKHQPGFGRMPKRAVMAEDGVCGNGHASKPGCPNWREALCVCGDPR